MEHKNEQTRLFIVEDDTTYGRLLKYVAEMNPDYEVYWFKSGKECIENLHLNPSVVSLDYSLPDMTGVQVLKKIKQHNKSIGIVVISGQQDVGTAVELLKAGAYDYIIKNEEMKERFLNTISNLLRNQHLENEVENLRTALHDKHQFGNRVKGESPAMQQVFSLLMKAANSNITVSITGETGTGKEVAAQTIHYNSDRKKGNFVAINMGAIPKELIESELFGHEKGAFTGAVTRKIGKFELADKGTLFLDEIAELDLSLQAKLLRALQEREITRVGGTKPVAFDARIIVATHRNLAEEVQKGTFRQDLYYRLLGLTIKLPPLKDRGNDIILLAQSFAEEYTKRNNMHSVQISRDAKNKLLSYAFPGNVRELKAIIDLACVLCNNNIIKSEDLQFTAQAPNVMNAVDSDEEVSLRELTNRIIFQYLNKYDNDVQLVAKKLDIGKSTIYRLLSAKNEENSHHS